VNITKVIATKINGKWSEPKVTFALPVAKTGLDQIVHPMHVIKLKLLQGQPLFSDG
jgi:hypothetical protein